jgi:hypothetical protein
VLIGITDRSAPSRQLITTDGVEMYKTSIFSSPDDAFPAPTAFLIEQAPRDTIRPHFHFSSQIQVFAKGSGTIGRRSVAGYVVHYADAHTGYGPIIAGDEGLWYLTLRPSRPASRPGFQPVAYLPESMPILDRGSKQFQLHTPITEVDTVPEALSFVRELIAPQERGLAAWWLRIGPGETVVVPTAPNGLARYCLVANGSLVESGRTLEELSLTWSLFGETPTLAAGSIGADVFVLQFPGDAA